MAAKEAGAITVPPVRWIAATFTIRGNAPYVQHRFGAKAQQIMHDTQAAGSTAKKGKKREGKDFEATWNDALHKSEDGWHGIPAAAIRKAMVSACRLVGFKMTIAKLSVFTEADGFDAEDWSPLIRITKGEPEYSEMYARNDNGSIDLRARPFWRPGWEAEVRIRFDADQFTLADITNLLGRVGQQVGVGEGRPDSRNSTGMGWGTFDVLPEVRVA